LLLGLPVALVVVAIARILFSSFKTGFQKAGWVFLSTLLLAFSFATISHQVGWQARWVKDRSVMVNLAQLDGAGKYSVYWIDDRYILGGEDFYRFYEWSSMFKKVWGDETRIGLDIRYYTDKDFQDFEPYFTKRYNLGEFHPGGRQAALIIRQGARPRSEVGLVARYYFHRFLRPRRMAEFLAGVTQVEVNPKQSRLAGVE
jgi:hypothetical protein